MDAGGGFQNYPNDYSIMDSLYRLNKVTIRDQNWKTIGGTQVMDKSNTLDRNTALRLFTAGGYQLIKDTLKGSIQPVYYADLVMLSKDYFEVEEEEIKTIVSKLTIVDGRVVYGSGEFSSLAPAVLKVLPEWSPVNFYGCYQH